MHNLILRALYVQKIKQNQQFKALYGYRCYFRRRSKLIYIFAVWQYKFFAIILAIDYIPSPSPWLIKSQWYRQSILYGPPARISAVCNNASPASVLWTMRELRDRLNLRQVSPDVSSRLVRIYGTLTASPFSCPPRSLLTLSRAAR